MGRAGVWSGLVVTLLTVALGWGASDVAAAGPSDGRHYELATPPDKAGQAARLAGLSPDGTVVRFDTPGGNGLPETGSHRTQDNSYVSRREAGGWEYLPMNLDASQVSTSSYLDASPSLDLQLFRGVVDRPLGRAAFYLRRAGDPPVQMGSVLTNRGGSIPLTWIPQFAGASADLTHVVVSAVPTNPDVPDNAYLPEDPLPSDSGGPPKLYEITAGSPALRRVDVDDSGSTFGACGGVLGSSTHVARAVSADGRRIFFTLVSPCSPQLYARVDGTHTVELSASECDRVADPGASPPVAACTEDVDDVRYESASADGTHVFFTSSDQLTNSDTDDTPDLYMYDFDAPTGRRLTQVSQGDATDATRGSGAAVQGFLRESDDGSRATFVAQGVLTTSPNAEGQVAVPGENNLYLFEPASGRTVFVATLDPNDFLLWAVNDTGGFRSAQLADPAGRYLVFSSVAQLTADDTDTTSDVYRYDADTGALQRVSIGRSGYGGNGNDDALGAQISGPTNDIVSLASVTSASRQVSSDGSRIVFATGQALESADDNAASDVYEWHDGSVSLISDGHDPAGVGTGSNLPFLISADGSSVAFSTSERLVPSRDADTAADIYVARTGSDVPVVPPPPAAPCSGEACQGRAVPAAPLAAPGSTTFTGGQNLPPGTSAQKVVARRARMTLGTKATLKIAAPSPGRLPATGPGLRATRKVVSRKATYAVRVTLSSRAAKTLKRRGTFKVKAKIVFSPSAGGSSTVHVSLTFRSTSKGR